MGTLVLPPKPAESFSPKILQHDKSYDKEIVNQDYHTRKCPGDVEIPNRVFIKGFSHDTTEEELKDFFAIYGVVHEAKIIKDRHVGSSKGYAFITFDSQKIAEKMIEIGNVPYKDRVIVIGPAQIRKKRPPHSWYNSYWSTQHQAAEQYSYCHYYQGSFYPAYHPSSAEQQPILYYQPPQNLPVMQTPSVPNPIHYQVTEQMDPQQTTPQTVPCPPQVSYAQIVPVSSVQQQQQQPQQQPQQQQQQQQQQHQQQQQQGTYVGNHTQYYTQGRPVVPPACHVTTHENMAPNTYSISNLTQSTNSMSLSEQSSPMYVPMHMYHHQHAYQHAYYYEIIQPEEKAPIPETMEANNQVVYLEGNKVAAPTMVSREIPTIMKRETPTTTTTTATLVYNSNA